MEVLICYFCKIKFNIQRLYESHVRIFEAELNAGCPKAKTHHGDKNSTQSL
jgi:hypothetical protein